MSLVKKYIQFNELVIDQFDMLASADLSGGFKTGTIEYSFGHGSYAPFKSSQQFATEQSLSMTLKLDIRKLSNEQQKYYKDFVTINLLKPGRLWAVQGNDLLWAYAYVKDFSETYGVERYGVSLDVNFVIYEGIWHKADARKVFLKPYEACNALDNEDFRTIDECRDCLDCSTPQNVCPTCIAMCDFLLEEHSLCAQKEVLNELYNSCGSSYQIIYNCKVGEHIWGEKMLGQKICKEDSCKNIIAGQFYSDTVLDTDQVTITIKGALRDPIITINGNSLKIMGEYDGTLTIMANGEVYYSGNSCCKDALIGLENIVIPEGSSYGFLVHHGLNGLIVETHDCCKMACAYIKVDSITI